MIVYISNRFVAYECSLAPSMLYAICKATETGDVHCLVRISHGKTFAYFGAEKIDMRRTFTDEVMKNIACDKTHVPTY